MNDSGRRDRPESMKSSRSKGKPQSVHHRPRSPTASLASLLSGKSDWNSVTEQQETSSPGQKTSSQTTSRLSVSLQKDLKIYRVNLDSLDRVPDEMPTISGTYTELHLSLAGTLQADLIMACAIFKTILPGRDKPSRRVLTNGIAGIGKTYSTRKFALDWARGLENHDITLLVHFSFRDLNLLKDEHHSLLTLMHTLHPTLKKVTEEQLTNWEVGFIFDGLNESKIPLNFQNIDIDSDDFDGNDVVSDPTVTTSMGVLLANLFKGNLLPSALLWVTSRPEAARQIPPECFDMVTEIRGFTDLQKEAFFRKKFGDDIELASTVISHVKTYQSIRIMCHVPLYCWMTATVVEDHWKMDKTLELPKNLQDIFSHFVLMKTRKKIREHDETRELKTRKKAKDHDDGPSDELMTFMECVKIVKAVKAAKCGNQPPESGKPDKKRTQKVLDRVKRDPGDTEMDYILKLGKLAFEDLANGVVW